jgi:hypothetical protein
MQVRYLESKVTPLDAFSSLVHSFAVWRECEPGLSSPLERLKSLPEPERHAYRSMIRHYERVEVVAALVRRELPERVAALEQFYGPLSSEALYGSILSICLNRMGSTDHDITDCEALEVINCVKRNAAS